MLSRIVYLIAALALALAAPTLVPGGTSVAFAASAQAKKCTAKWHRHTKVASAKPAKAVKPVQPSGGGAGAQLRRTPDIQILSFGP